MKESGKGPIRFLLPMLLLTGMCGCTSFYVPPPVEGSAQVTIPQGTKLGRVTILTVDGVAVSDSCGALTTRVSPGKHAFGFLVGYLDKDEGVWWSYGSSVTNELTIPGPGKYYVFLEETRRERRARKPDEIHVRISLRPEEEGPDHPAIGPDGRQDYLCLPMHQKRATMIVDE